MYFRRWNCTMTLVIIMVYSWPFVPLQSTTGLCQGCQTSFRCSLRGMTWQEAHLVETRYGIQDIYYLHPQILWASCSLEGCGAKSTVDWLHCALHWQGPIRLKQCCVCSLHFWHHVHVWTTLYHVKVYLVCSGTLCKGQPEMRTPP